MKLSVVGQSGELLVHAGLETGSDVFHAGVRRTGDIPTQRERSGGNRLAIDGVVRKLDFLAGERETGFKPP